MRCCHIVLQTERRNRNDSTVSNGGSGVWKWPLTRRAHFFSLRRSTLDKMLLLVLLTVSVSCHYAWGEESAIDEARRNIVTAELAFSFDLYQAIRADAGVGNTLVSPLSVASALALVLCGAGGRTAQELRRVMHLEPHDTRSVAEGYRAIKQSLQVTGRDEPTLRFADKTYLRRGLSLKREFRKIAIEYFGADAEEIDFAPSEVARAKINRWVEFQTNEKIRDILPTGSPSSNTQMIIVNAMYMKATWMKPFKTKDTKQSLFYRLTDPPIKVPMMNRRAEFQIGELVDLHSTMLVLPYMGLESRLKMVLILPKEKYGLEKMESGLADFNWNRIVLAHRSVRVTIPKFKIEVKHELNDHLTQMGLTSLFAPGANLSGIAEGNMFVSKAVQKTFIDVDENGTEAAAATALDVVRFSAPLQTAEFVADHPFMFLVMKENLILFMGRVTDPTQS